MNTINIYLIDDDETILKIWEINSKKYEGLKIFTFNSINQIKNEIPLTPCYLFLDVNLGESLLDKTDIIDLRQRGFNQIYLATGYQRSDLPSDLIELVSGVYSKDFPCDFLSSCLSLHE